MSGAVAPGAAVALTYRVLWRQLVTRGVHMGVYHFTTSRLTFEAACIAACLADDQAIVTGGAEQLLRSAEVRPRLAGRTGRSA